MLTFIKRTATSWQHDNGTVKSSFGGGIPITNDTENTIVFQLPNGTNFPIKAQLITDCKIIDKTDGDAEYTFSTTTEFLDKLEELNYPFINTGGGGGVAGVSSFNTRTGAVTSQSGDYTTAQLTESTNKKFVSDAQLVVIGNTSGTNTGDNATNSLYSGLAESKADKSPFLFQQSDRTLTSNTSAQDIFDVGVGGDGSITLDVDSTYHFEMELSMTGLSTTSGTVSLSFDAGTVGVALFKGTSIGKKAVFNNASTSVFVFFESTAVLPVTSATTVATANVFISGVIVTSTTGTFKPRVTMSQASASTVKAGTHLKMEKLGRNTDTHYPTE